jgi:RimK family alpha-L-glutamate ligase
MPRPSQRLARRALAPRFGQRLARPKRSLCAKCLAGGLANGGSKPNFCAATVGRPGSCARTVHRHRGGPGLCAAVGLDGWEGGAGWSVVRIGVVTAFPSEDWHSARLAHAVAERGAEPVVLDPASFSLGLSRAGLSVESGGRSVLALDALLLARGLSPRGDGDVQFEAYHQLVALGQPQVNSIGALLTAQDKVRASCFFARAGVRTPATRVVQTEQEALEALAELGWAVAKPRFGSLGVGMLRLRDDARGRTRLLEFLGREGGLYLQEYVETGGEDFRVFVVGGKAVGAVRRKARRGEWRTNFAQGGSSEPYQPAAAMCRLAVAAARAVGLSYTAVDVVRAAAGPAVLEVNGHPNFELIWDASGIDVGGAVADLVIAKARAYRRRMRAPLGAAPARSAARQTEAWAVQPPPA